MPIHNVENDRLEFTYLPPIASDKQKDEIVFVVVLFSKKYLVFYAQK